MHINKATVNAFLQQIDNPKTHDAYRATLNAFEDFCNGHIDLDRADDFAAFRRSIGRSAKTIRCDRSIITCLRKFALANIGTGTNSRNVKQVKPNINLNSILAAYEKVDEKALAFALSKLNEAYNKACDSVRNSTANMNWDAASWDEASARCKRAYDGLRRVRDVINLMDEMYQAKAGVRE